MSISATEESEVLDRKNGSVSPLTQAWSGDGEAPAAATLFNSALAATAIAALFEVGFFDEIASKTPVSLADFCRTRDAHLPSVRSLLYVLNCFDIIRVAADEDSVSPGALFSEVDRNKGYFLWLVGGYGTMLQSLGARLENRNREGDLMQRDGRRIAMSGRDYGAHFVDRHFLEMLDEVPCNVVADLGCGSGERLMKLARSRPGMRGFGLDLNEGAVNLAQTAVAEAGLADRLTVLHDNVGNLKPRKEFEEVELIFCFFMGHDLWPREECLKSLQQIRAVFPNVKRFLLSDTYRSDLPAAPDVPIFTLGFELTHAVMGQYIPSVAEWIDLFADAGWNCVARRDLDIPFSSIFDLR